MLSPTVLTKDGFRFHFHSGDVHEPPHVHADGSSGKAKVWLKPVRLAYSRGLTQAELRRILDITNEHQGVFLKAWAAFAAREGPERDR